MTEHSRSSPEDAGRSTPDSETAAVAGAIDKSALRAVGAILQDAGTIGLTSHTRPDGDAVGSVLALGSALRAIGKTVHMINEDGVPELLRFLPGWGDLRPASEFPDGVEVDVLVILDTGSRQRMGDRTQAVFRAWKKEVNIDHHASNPGYGDVNFIDTVSPATGQIVYQLIREMQWPLDEVARDSLFAAISSDTGSFRYPSTTAETFRIGADLLDAGADVGTISQKLYESYPLRRLELLRELMKGLEIRYQGRLAIFQLPLAVSQSLELQDSDSEGLIDLIRAVDSVVVAVFFEELEDGCIRISSRSKSPTIDVGAICSAFGGGGHTLAAGARMQGPLESAISTFTQAISDKFDEYN